MSKGGKCVGHALCPYCSDRGAEVKHDKNSHPYIVCFECEPISQHFTRGDPARIKNLLGGDKFKPLAGAELPAWAKPAAPAPAPEPAPKPAPRKTTLMG